MSDRHLRARHSYQVQHLPLQLLEEQERPQQMCEFVPDFQSLEHVVRGALHLQI